MSRTALFLDRDGTIIEDEGALGDPKDIEFIPDVIPALQELQKHYLLFVVTNQVWISQGVLSSGQVDRVNGALDSLLRDRGIEVQEWFVCPHQKSDKCGCRKPSPHFLLHAAEKYTIDLNRSFMIGDHPSDPQTGEAAGAFGLYVLTGHGMKHLQTLSDYYPVFHNLAEAGAWILQHPDPYGYYEEATAAGGEAIQEGELAVFPTETVYGIGADALNSKATARIFEAKKRPLHDPLIVHVSDPAQVVSLVTEVPKNAQLLMNAFWPGPLTLVLPKNENVPDLVTAGKKSVALRMPSHPLALKLISKAGVPVAAPSANLFGRTSPTSAEHVKNQLEGAYKVLIDGGICRVGVESTVISLTGKTPALLRAGGLALEDIENVIGPVTHYTGDGNSVQGRQSPGQLADHYAPLTPLKIVDDIERYRNASSVGKLLFSGSGEGFLGPTIILSPEGNVQEAAVKLYHAMQQLDASGVELIAAERAPEEGLGRAINDRLEKASTDKQT
ncbi:MAG: L-threonylcarbamoyladenylate synthase [Spirochaetia bacterium]